MRRRILLNVEKIKNIMLDKNIDEIILSKRMHVNLRVMKNILKNTNKNAVSILTASKIALILEVSIADFLI